MGVLVGVCVVVLVDVGARMVFVAVGWFGVLVAVGAIGVLVGVSVGGGVAVRVGVAVGSGAGQEGSMGVRPVHEGCVSVAGELLMFVWSDPSASIR